METSGFQSMAPTAVMKKPPSMCRRAKKITSESLKKIRVRCHKLGRCNSSSFWRGTILAVVLDGIDYNYWSGNDRGRETKLKPL